MRVARRAVAVVAGGVLLVLAGSGIALAHTRHPHPVPGGSGLPMPTLSCPEGFTLSVPSFLGPRLVAFLAGVTDCPVNGGKGSGGGGDGSGGG